MNSHIPTLLSNNLLLFLNTNSSIFFQFKLVGDYIKYRWVFFNSFIRQFAVFLNPNSEILITSLLNVAILPLKMILIFPIITLRLPNILFTTFFSVILITIRGDFTAIYQNGQCVFFNYWDLIIFSWNHSS